MKELRKILFTFDYELFLGKRSGTVNNCLIQPTNAILEVLAKHNNKGVFFIDTTYLLCLKAIAETHARAADDYKIVTRQIQSIAKAGHHIGLHVHPHWLDASYQSDLNEWDLENKSRFALSNLETAESSRLFTDCYTLLNQIIADGGTEYKVSSFRAGGLYVQPFDIFKPLYIQSGIKYDFNVLKGFVSQGTGYAYNYSTTPASPVYRFSNEVTVEDSSGPFTEFSLEGIDVNYLAKVLNGLWYRSYMKYGPGMERWGDGSSSGNIIRAKEKASFLKSSETLSVELLNDIKAWLYMNKIRKQEYVHFISHPKLVSPYNVKAFAG